VKIGWPALALLLLAGSAAATHVTDKLAVGVYASSDGGQPLRLLTSGTPVERLELSGQYCKVRLGDGEEGWVECRYLTDEKPARAMLLEAQAANAGLRRELDESREQLQALELERAQLARRLAAAENLLAGQLPEAEPPPPAVGQTQATLEIEGAEPVALPLWGGWLPLLAGLSIGLVVGGALFFWRCRRRYGGLRI